MTPVDDVLVRCDGLARTYGNGPTAVVAVHGATCKVRAGQLIAVMGPSGSGKSTLLHLFAGLDTPTAGTITWPALGDRSALRPGPVGVIFQAPSLLPPLNVVENVALPLLLLGVDRTDATRAAHDALTRLDLKDLAGKLPEELSGGQAQRVAVARVLAARPRLILADEPTGQLDRDTGRHIVEVLLDAADELGAALVVSTHDREVAERLHQRWSMTDGGLTVAEEAPCSP